MADSLSLGEFEQLVLLALVRLGEQGYGVSIHNEIVRRARREVTVAAVYKTLERLELKGFAVSTVGEPTAERGGRRKKYFRIQPAGRRALAHALASLRRMAEGLAPDLDGVAADPLRADPLRRDEA
jgi:PadR family transcriptional regulator PadR